MRTESEEQKYMTEVFGLGDADLARIRERLIEKDEAYRAVAPNEARILQFLIRGFGVRKVLEVGMLFGYSTLAMAKALPSDGVIVSLENDPGNFAVARGFFDKSSDGGKIIGLLGDAKVTLAQAEAHGPFDMAFIDADKGGYAGYLDWAEKNVRRGGLIVGDNTFLFGALWGQSRNANIGEGPIRVMKEFNKRLADPARYNSIMIPTQEGITVAQKLF